MIAYFYNAQKINDAKLKPKPAHNLFTFNSVPVKKFIWYFLMTTNKIGYYSIHFKQILLSMHFTFVGNNE